MSSAARQKTNAGLDQHAGQLDQTLFVLHTDQGATNRDDGLAHGWLLHRLRPRRCDRNELTDIAQSSMTTGAGTFPVPTSSTRLNRDFDLD